jgi:3-oxoacid CoA-transferase subunit A
MALVKVVGDAREALDRAGIQNGATIMMGGFGLCGIPENLIRELRERGTRDLTVISNNAGVDDFGIGLLLRSRQVRRMVSSYVGENALFESLYLSGELELEFVPQGTFAERIRAGGAGVPAFYTPTGVGTLVAEGKEIRTFEGKEYLMERGLKADFAFIKAYRSDPWGNLVYRKTARNFNPMMATAAKVVIAEVEELVPVGSLDPECIVTPSVYVDMVFQADHEKRIEQRTTRAREGTPS